MQIQKYRRLFEGKSFLRENKETSMNEKQLFDGGGKGRILPLIKDVIKKYDAIRVLDYGCGYGNDWHMPLVPNGDSDKITTPQLFGEKLVGFHRYDPAYELYSADPPGLFNVIICTDVMEHVPMEDIPEVLKHIRSKCTTDGIVLFSIPTIPSKNAFLDGENMHCTIMDGQEWKKIINKYLKRNVIINAYG
jgi:2-polyprenyl-3-methyl-5-hydroxy-6-metoxy-1,4-benzoquinol methylase